MIGLGFKLKVLSHVHFPVPHACYCHAFSLNESLFIDRQLIYLHEARKLTQAIVSDMVLIGVVKITKNGQRNAQQAYHQIRNGQVKEK